MLFTIVTNTLIQALNSRAVEMVAMPWGRKAHGTSDVRGSEKFRSQCTASAKFELNSQLSLLLHSCTPVFSTSFSFSPPFSSLLLPLARKIFPYERQTNYTRVQTRWYRRRFLLPVFGHKRPRQAALLKLINPPRPQIHHSKALLRCQILSYLDDTKHSCPHAVLADG
jgi:hypothetical protein